MRVESRSFATLNDGDAQDFLWERGYVVLEPLFERAHLSEALEAWRALKARCAADLGLGLGCYEAQICQWRDLWIRETTFAALIEDRRLWGSAVAGMGGAGARLLHDHLIAKPYGGLNATIPWHQDATLWPVDRSGLSCWLPLRSVGPSGGCLEVVVGSHLWEPGEPMDFIARPRREFPADAKMVRLPARAGSLVVLDGLTWHRSGPNLDGGERPVHISLWLPPETRYAPHHAAWHPVNEQVEVESGERLEGAAFPCFMASPSFETRAARRLEHAGPELELPLSMFEASRVIGSQICRILGGPELSLAQVLSTATARAVVAARAGAMELLVPGREEELLEVLEQMWISAESYGQHRARNVYNAAYVSWWELVGQALWQWETRGADS